MYVNIESTELHKDEAGEWAEHRKELHEKIFLAKVGGAAPGARFALCSSGPASAVGALRRARRKQQ